MNVDQARKIFEQEVMASKFDCVLVEGATREYPCCFVFIYQSKKFVETGDFGQMLVGQGPVLISREDGRVFETGSAFPIDHYVKAFEACGDPNGLPTQKVKVIGCNAGANKVQATKCIKAKSELSLSEAKAVIDSALLSEESIFTAGTVEDAEEAVATLKEYGFNSKQLWSNQC
jgi:ribosomal protein L7/L12